MPSNVETMPESRIPILSVFTIVMVSVVHLTVLVGGTTGNKMHYIHWNTSNPIFRIDNTDHIIDVNKNDVPFDYDQVNIICPTYDKSTKDHETEKYIIYNVSKEEYDTCRITTLHPRVITVCNRPYELMYVTITFRPFSPQPNGLEFRQGVDYYFISTSSSDDLERRVGGRCSSHHMKVVFKVCCDPDKQSKPLGDQGGVQQLGHNGANNRRGGGGLLPGNSTFKQPTTTLSTPKSGRTTTFTTSSTPTTTTTSSPSRRLRPYDVDGYDNSKYAVHKDYPHYVKTTTRKIDTRKYPDPRENEVVKNEALNSSPHSTTTHQVSLWWVLVVLSAIVVVMRTGDCSLRCDLGAASRGGDNSSLKARKTCTGRHGGSNVEERNTLLTDQHYVLQRNQHDSVDTPKQTQHMYRPSSQLVDSSQQQHEPVELLTQQLKPHQQQCQWLHQRRKFNNQINSYRCRSRLSGSSAAAQSCY